MSCSPYEDPEDLNTDTVVVGALVALYFVLSLVLLPLEEYPRALIGGTAVFGSVAVAAYHAGRGPLSGSSMLAVAFISAVMLVIPAFPALGGTAHRVGVPLGFLGMQTAVLIWAAFRWQQPPPAKERISLKEAWTFAFFIALALSAVATIPVLLIVMIGGGIGVRILWVYPAYFVGFAAAATLYWLLQRIAHLATGRYLIGFLGGMCVYGAAAPIAALFRPMSPSMMLLTALIAGGLVGPALALDPSPAEFNT